MLESRKEIRETHMMPADAVIASLPLPHAGLAPLREMGVLISGVDERCCPQEWGEGKSPTHLLFMVTRGEAQYHAAHPPLTVAVGQLLIVPGGVAKRLSLSGDAPLRAIWFHLLDVPEWAQLRADHASVRPLSYLAVLDAVQQQLLAECQYENAVAMESCLLLSRLLVNYLRREVLQHESVAQQGMQRLLQALWAEVTTHPEHDWTVAELAARVGLSPGHLHRLVRLHQHAGPMAIVTRIRMTQAARLLRTTAWSIDGIATAVGYQSPYAFSHAFLRYAGMRPGAFRKQ